MGTTIPTFTRDFNGPIIIIGFGTIGKGILPLIKRHFNQRESLITVISPDDTDSEIARKYGANFICKALTPENYTDTLNDLIATSDEKAFIVNLATEVSSKDLLEFSLEKNCHYIDTVIEPWPGFYLNPELTKEDQSNYALRESLSDLRNRYKDQTTAISCCGANPGMVSWFVKKALMDIAKDNGLEINKPNTRAEWGELMKRLNIKGIHIAEKDDQVQTKQREAGTFVNTWSVDGCIAECMQPAELGWGTHEKQLPPDGHEHKTGSKASIYLETPGGSMKVKTWTPTYGNHAGFLITHNESISISDYFTIKDSDGQVIYRPTCHYAYHPSDDTVASLEEMFGQETISQPNKIEFLTENNIISGADELGVLLYGNEKGAYWYGSKLTNELTKELVPHQNATGLQVSSAVLAGMYYTLDHPNAGLLETDEMDFEECLEIQEHYLGELFGNYTNWVPENEAGEKDYEWQFSSFRITQPEIKN